MHKTLSLCFAFLFLSSLSYAKLRDPTAPNCHNPSPTPILILSAKNRKIVLIGDRYFKVGDIYMGATIVKITQDAIHLQNKTKKFILPISQTDFKQPVSKKESPK